VEDKGIPPGQENSNPLRQHRTRSNVYQTILFVPINNI